MLLAPAYWKAMGSVNAVYLYKAVSFGALEMGYGIGLWGEA